MLNLAGYWHVMVGYAYDALTEEHVVMLLRN